MVDEHIGLADLSIGEILTVRRERQHSNQPNIRFTDYAILKNGPRAYKVVRRQVIVNQETGEYHHDGVTIETYRHRKGGKASEKGWTLSSPNSITLDNDEGDEIAALHTFLSMIVGDLLPEKSGEYLVTPVGGGNDLDRIRNVVGASSSSDKSAILVEIIDQIDNYGEVISHLLDQVRQNPESARYFSAAMNVSRFKAAIAELEALIQFNSVEEDYQKFLALNPWMFGSEYSELLDRRAWVRDSQTDFMLRRTVDGYLEIVEIKRTLDGHPLFNYDSSHDCFYPRADLTKVIGQVMHYIDRIEKQIHSIRAEDGERVDKIRAKIIIGRDIDDGQIAELRKLNGHLHRIEILTFDQLVKTAKQVVSYLEHEVPERGEEPPPF